MIFIQNSLFVGAVNVSQFLGSKAGILTSKFWKSSWLWMYTTCDVRLSALYTTHDAKFPEDKATFDEYFQKIWSCERPKWPLVWVWQSVELFDILSVVILKKLPQVPLVYPDNQLYLDTNSIKNHPLFVWLIPHSHPQFPHHHFCHLVFKWYRVCVINFFIIQLIMKGSIASNEVR